MPDPVDSTEMQGSWPRPGDQYVFLDENGYDQQRQNARAAGFIKGQAYEVERCEVGNWDHSVKFKGMDGWHNGVMFARQKEPQPAMTTPDGPARAAVEEIAAMRSEFDNHWPENREAAMQKAAAIIARHFSPPAGQREAFEAEAKRLGLDTRRHSKESGPYHVGDYVESTAAGRAWHFWQAALSHPPRAAVLSESESELVESIAINVRAYPDYVASLLVIIARLATEQEKE